MPIYADAEAAQNLDPLRVCCYGEPKTRKTWWAATAAEAGYNVLLIDTDDGTHILKNLSADAKKRISVVRVVDTLTDNIGSTFVAKFVSGDRFYWAEGQGKQQPPTVAPITPDPVGYFMLDPTKMTKNDVVILDSYTSFVFSVGFQYSKENNIEWQDAQKTEWDGYGWAGRFVNQVLARLHALPCHFIMIGHVDVYEKARTEGKNRIVEWTRTQLKSVSGPHAKQIGKHFSDILFFKLMAQDTKIDVRPSASRDSGSRNLQPKAYDFASFKFGDLAVAAGHKLPVDAPPSEGFRWLPNFDAVAEDFQKMRAEAKAKSAAAAPTKPAPQVLSAATASNTTALVKPATTGGTTNPFAKK